MKIALVGIVKNEESDILSWISWHAQLGINTFIIFDDGSDDGTCDLLNTAAIQYDIRLFQIKCKIETVDYYHSYEERQKHVYCDVLKSFGSLFDWIGFLDADEYLNLYHSNSLQELFNSLDPDIGAVGFHWCIYGSNNYLTRPDMPPFHAFTRHSLPTEGINYHIKTFIRPSFWNGEWGNPHYFPLHTGRYTTPSGAPISWSHTKGITETDPEWHTAKVMHYQVRSLEHYIARARRRHDRLMTLDGFHHADLNAIEDTQPHFLTQNVLHDMRLTVQQGAALALLKLAKRYPPPAAPLTTTPSTNVDTLKISSLLSWKKEPFEVQSERIYPVDAPTENKSQLFLLQTHNTPQKGFLFTCNNHNELNNFSILYDSRLTGFPHYDIIPFETDGRIALRQNGGISGRKTYLTSPPYEPLLADRPKATLWETFYLTPHKTNPHDISWDQFPYFQLLTQMLQQPVTLTSIVISSQLDRHATIALLPILAAHLSSEDKNKLQLFLGPFAPYIL